MNEGSLRDHFAGVALGGAINGAHGIGQMEPEERTKLLLMLAGLCYEIADAMMVARKGDA